MTPWLFTEQGRQYLLEQYVAAKRSTYDIAKERKTNANHIRRALIKHRIDIRNHSEAQTAALASGRHKHPTKGRKREEQERNAISEGMKTSHEPDNR